MSSRNRGPPKPTPRWSSTTAGVVMLGFFLVWLALGYAFRPSDRQKIRFPVDKDASAAAPVSASRGTAADTASAPGASAASPALPSPPPASTCTVFGSLGMTWSVKLHDAGTGADYVSCKTPPAIPQRGDDCNAIHGDTSCSSTLPILCIKKLKLPKPAGLPSCDNPSMCAWSGGQLALTPAMQGCLMTTPAKADELCATYAGPDFVMAGFHEGRADGGNGWGFYGQSDLFNATPPTRFWVKISDQKANCWDPRGAVN